MDELSVYIGAEHGDNFQQPQQQTHQHQSQQGHSNQAQNTHHLGQHSYPSNQNQINSNTVTSAPQQHSNQGPDLTYNFDHSLPSQNEIQHTIDLTRSSSRRPNYSSARPTQASRRPTHLSRKPDYKSRPNTVLSYGK